MLFYHVNGITASVIIVTSVEAETEQGGIGEFEQSVYFVGRLNVCSGVMMEGRAQSAFACREGGSA